MELDPVFSILASALTIRNEVKKIFDERGLSRSVGAKKADYHEALLNYLDKEYNRVSKITSFAFVGKRELLDMYVPVTLFDRTNDIKIPMENIIRFEEIKQDKILVVDSAGMGKSTMSKFIFVASMRSEKYIPILLEIRKYEGDIEFEKHVFNSIFGELEYNEDIIKKLLNRKDVILIIDGLDEIKLDQKVSAVSKIYDVIENHSCKIVLTSRPDEILASFNHIMRYRMMPFVPEKAIELIRKIDPSGEKGNLLISKLSEIKPTKSLRGRTRSISIGGDIGEFLENPLLICLLYKSFEHKNEIPLKKFSFYRQVYDALYGDHDLSKGDAFVRQKNSKLGSEDFHKLTRAFAFITFADGVVEYTKDQIFAYLVKCKEIVREFSFDSGEYLKDLYSTVPIFIQEGDTYRWSHKSFQEYFASQFIIMDAAEEANNIMMQIYSSDRISYYVNFLDFVYDSSYNLFESSIIYTALSELRNYVDKFVAENSISGIPENLIIDRALLCFKRKYVVVPYVYNRAELNPESYDARDYFDTAREFEWGSNSMRINHFETCVNVVACDYGGGKEWLFRIMLKGKQKVIVKSRRIKKGFDKPIVKKAKPLSNGKAIYNSKKNYEIMNQIIHNTTDFRIDYSELLKMLDKIENSRKVITKFKLL